MKDGQTETLPEARPRTQQSDLWAVVVLNDPVNLMTYVVMVFRRVFGYSRAKAHRHMLEVHQRGRSRLWEGGREEAESYVHTLQRWHLQAILERHHD